MGRYSDKKDIIKRKQEAYEYFIEQGYTPEQSSGIVGNLVQESNLQTTVISSFAGEGSFGIAQWNPSSKAGDRLGKLKSFAKNKGTDPGDFRTQLEFIIHELDTVPHLGKSKLLKARNAEEAATVFSNLYERPSKKYAHNDKRIANAKSVYLQFQDKNTYSKDEKGQIVVLNPEVVTEKDKQESPSVKREFYDSVFNIPNERPKSAEPKPVVEAKAEIEETKQEFEFKNKLGDILTNMEPSPEENIPVRPFNFEQSNIKVQENEFFQFFNDGGEVNPTDPRNRKRVSESTSVRKPMMKLPNQFKPLEELNLEEVKLEPKKEDIVDKILKNADFPKKKLKTAEDFVLPDLNGRGINLQNSTNGRSFRKGDRGDDVRNIQSFLINQGMMDSNSVRGSSNTDGIYGNITKRAVEKFQKANGLKVDGILGKQTLQVIQSKRDKKIENELLLNPKIASSTAVRKPIYKEVLGQVRKAKEDRDLSLYRKSINAIPLMARAFIEDTFGGESPITEENLNDGELEALKAAVRHSLNSKTDRITYNTWRTVGAGGTDVRTDDVNFANPAVSLQKTLGQANIVQEENGNLYVVDRYNFNDAGDKNNRNSNSFTDEEGLLPLDESTSFSNGIYRVARNFKTKFGSAEGGMPSRIYVGNVADFK